MRLFGEYAPYSKAIVAAVGAILAVGVAIWRQDVPDAIPGIQEAIVGAITSVLVWFIPNLEHRGK